MGSIAVLVSGIYADIFTDIYFKININ